VSDRQAAVLSADQREVPGQALADALSYRTPDGERTGCDEHPGGPGNDHAADLDLTDAYLALTPRVEGHPPGLGWRQSEGWHRLAGVSVPTAVFSNVTRVT